VLVPVLQCSKEEWAACGRVHREETVSCGVL
jgi:hypothetical protein